MVLAALVLPLVLGGRVQAGTYIYTGGLQKDTITLSGTYEITATGAQGGNANNSASGGLGAAVSGEITLTAGTTLEIVVGGQGLSGTGIGGGGGGGSFIYVSGPSSLLLVAGGGGGAYAYGNDGGAGQIGPDGQNGFGGGGAGGSAGSGGGGGGWSGSGDNSVGGGGGDLSNHFAGGGGYGGGDGGYSGGGGGSYGGGGGSFLLELDFTNTSLTGGANSGDGQVTITLVPASVPEPSSLVLAGTAILAGLGYAWRRRQGRTRS